MPVDFDRYMVGYAASAYLDDAFDRYATYSMFLSKSFYEFNIFLTSVNLAL